LADVSAVKNTWTVGYVEISKFAEECGVVSATQQPSSVDALQTLFDQTVEYKEVDN
jgi:hypothetical protein